MTAQQLRDAPIGTKLHDAKVSQRLKENMTATIKEKDHTGVLLDTYLGEVVISYDQSFMYDLLPEDKSTLPFY